jgi:hypothetical protein
MNTKQIQKFVMRYLEATDCHIIEKNPAYVTVKLSPEADKSLTNRTYYWSFIDRTGTPPETMSFKFVFDPEKLQAEEAAAEARKSAQNTTQEQGQSGSGGAPLPNTDTILGRYFGIVVPPPAGPGRITKDDVTYGSRRLEQLFQVVKAGGRFVQMFEEPGTASRAPFSSAYTSWLAVNYKIEFLCDMKRDELHSLGINLTTGELVPHFHETLLHKKLSPRFPVNGHIPRQQVTITRARTILEQHLEKWLKQTDHSWAASAHDRMMDELARVDNYYSELYEGSDEAAKPQVAAQWESRKQEMEWQYKPRVQVNAINCGIFHLRSE